MGKRAIAILSAGVRRDKKGVWSNSNLTEQSDSLGAPGGRQRVIAASYLYKLKPDYFLIACGGRGYDIKDKSPNRPDLCQITRRELIKLKVPADKIITENKSNTSFEQLRELKKIIIKFKLETILIISSQYHLPRVKALINLRLKPLKKDLAAGAVKLVSAEKILLKQNPEKWREPIKRAYSSEWMKLRIKKERQGIKDLKSNKYKF